MPASCSGYWFLQLTLLILRFTFARLSAHPCMSSRVAFTFFHSPSHGEKAPRTQVGAGMYPNSKTKINITSIYMSVHSVACMSDCSTCTYDWVMNVHVSISAYVSHCLQTQTHISATVYTRIQQGHGPTP